MPEIIIIDTRSPQETKAIQLNPEERQNHECLIGRDERCCIILHDNLASRTHGKITFRNGKHFYCDLGSRNGSKINNENIQVNREYLLKPSDTITVGNHLLWVKAIAKEENTFAPQLTPKQYMPLAGIDIASLETWTQGTKQVKCVQIIQETVDVKTFTFTAEPPVKFNYQPGQFLTFNLNIDGKQIKSSHSISSSPSRPHTLEIPVKVGAGDNSGASGLGSKWLYEHLKVGSQITVNAPQGKFTNFAHPSAKLLLISAGIGIAPMISMSRWIFDTAANVDIVFLHTARSPQEIIFRQELEIMSARYANFSLAIIATYPGVGQPWYGYRGKINETLLPAIAPDYQDRTVYVCGSNSFMEATQEILKNIGFPMKNFHRENYQAQPEESLGRGNQLNPPAPTVPPEERTAIFPPPPAVDQTSLTPIKEPMPAMPSTLIVSSFSPVSSSSDATIVLSKSGQEIACNRDEYILNVAEAAGANLPFGCRMGVCGTCKVKKISGEVIYDDKVACEDSFVYTCVAHPVGKVVIEA